ncbi:MAG: phosphoribosylformylglycinamidine cyclo-ligase [Nitrospirae bacterium]|nr:phosphoribosylformylglycinamidine cyclo-ligase [Candidatus Manganitrophaceae bacterium]
MARLTYKKAGVDIEAGDLFIQKITPLVRSTFRPEVLTDLGGFSGLFSLRSKKYKEPVLVSGTDGVGTKLKIAFMTDRHDTVGIDLVAMCVNDVIVTGAEPLFFLDYFATGKLFPEKAVEVMKGIVEGCRQAGCALIGGETAEMPSFYPAGEYDLAGFAVGVVDKKKIIDGKKIRPGDLLVGLASSGLHSNGFSLVRKILFEKGGLTVKDRLPGESKTVGEILLTPTVIYVKAFAKLMEKVQIKGAAHITGGGITENLPRVLPKGCAAQVRRDRWPVPSIFPALQKIGEVDTEEMYTDFNMGIGMILVLSPKDLRPALSILKRQGHSSYVIGEIIKGKGEVLYV